VAMLWWSALLLTLALALGLATRWVGPALFGVGGLLGSVFNSFGKIAHDSQVLLLLLMCWMFSDWGAAWSLDARRRGLRVDALNARLGAEWPFVVSVAFLSMLYFSSAALKVLRGFLGPDNLVRFMQYRQDVARIDGTDLPAWTDWGVAFFVAHPAWAFPLQVGGLLIEAFFWVALLSRRLRIIALSAAACFHVGIGMLSDLRFFYPTMVALLLAAGTWLMLRSRNGPSAIRASAETRAGPLWVRQALVGAAAFVAALMVGRWVEGDGSLGLAALGPALTVVQEAANWAYLWPVYLVLASASLIGGAWWLARDAVRLVARPIDDGLERVLLYDQDCGFCQKWMEWARAHPQHRVRYEPCQSQVVLRKAAGISESQCLDSSMLVVLREGEPQQVLMGAAAINGAMERFAGGSNIGWRFLAAAYRLHGVQEAENLGYRWIANNRHRFGSGTCSVDEMRRQTGQAPALEHGDGR
jgi:predicted DCC family thiol-disulfide oxidoreductase YuxK